MSTGVHWWRGSNTCVGRISLKILAWVNTFLAWVNKFLTWVNIGLKLFYGSECACTNLTKNFPYCFLWLRTCKELQRGGSTLIYYKIKLPPTKAQNKKQQHQRGIDLKRNLTALMKDLTRYYIKRFVWHNLYDSQPFFTFSCVYTIIQVVHTEFIKVVLTEYSAF